MLGSFAAKVRATTTKLSYDQGVRCARNQISTVLICGFAITSLFYPAFGVLLWNKNGNQTSFWSILKENTVIDPNDFKSLNFDTFWYNDHSFISTTSNENYNEDLIIERVISPLDENYETVYNSLNLISYDRCLKFDENCLILSPISDTFNDSSYTITQFQGQTFAITTLFFGTTDDHDQWWSHSLSTNNDWSFDKGTLNSNYINLKHIDLENLSNWSSVPYIFGFAYALFVIHVSVSVSRLNQVHSRFGLAITGIAQLCVSTIMSISLLELCGFKLRLVPWTVIPFVIVVVGVENMLTIARAVVSTSISLPVPERVGQGMAKVGPVIGMTVLSDLTLLGIAGWLIPGTIREFCIFASVVSIIDYFLQSTFFITILSVDIQRLEVSVINKFENKTSLSNFYFY